MVEVGRESLDGFEVGMEAVGAVSESSPVVLGCEPSGNWELIDAPEQEGYCRMPPRVIDDGVSDFSIGILLVVGFITAHAFLVRELLDMRRELSKVRVGVGYLNPLL